MHHPKMCVYIIQQHQMMIIWCPAYIAARAMAHNDKSIQENHHLTTMFIMMSEDKSVHFLEVQSRQPQAYKK